MDQFEMFVARHGEHTTQELLENWERFVGIRHVEPLTLEQRWEIFRTKTDGFAA